MRTIALVLLVLNLLLMSGGILLGIELSGVVLLLGDSLIINAETDSQGVYSLDQALHQAEVFPKSYVVSAWWGDRVADLNARAGGILAITRPRAVVLLWDSDASDVDEVSMSPVQIVALRAAYMRNLRELIDKIRAAGAHVVVTGPGVMLDVPEKSGMLDDYVVMNRNVTSALGVDYIDLRTPLLQAAAAGNNPTTGTYGEHLNRAGFAIAARLISRNLDAAWRSAKSS